MPQEKILWFNYATILRQRQVAQNVWKLEVKFTNPGKTQESEGTFVVKAEKKSFKQKASDPAQSFSSRWNDMAWAIEVFTKAMQDSPRPVWARALSSGESAVLYDELDGASSSWRREEWAETPVQVVDWVDEVADFWSAKDGMKQQALSRILGTKEGARELGKGLAVDLFLGNGDRMAPDNETVFVNFDNFFFQGNQIIYMDFWDPNSVYNFRTTFDADDNYLGSLLKKKAGLQMIARTLADKISGKLGIVTKADHIAAGLELGKRAIAKACGDTRTSAVRSRLLACGIS